MGDWDVTSTSPVGDWDVISNQPHEAEPTDHGLSERQKLSPLGKAINPLTSYWDTYKTMNKEAREQASHGAGQLAHPDSAWDFAKGAGNVALGGLGYVTSPINAGYRSVVGQPIEDVTGIPREYTEFTGQMLTPGLGMTKLAKAPGVAEQVAPKIKPMQGPDFNSPTATANRAAADEFGIPLTRGQATEDLDLIRREDMASRGAHGKDSQDIAAPRFEQQFEDIQNAGQQVGQTLSRGTQPLGTPADAAASLSGEVGSAAEAGRTSRDAVLAHAEQAAARVRQEAADRAREITEGIAGDRPQIEHPTEAGHVAGQAVRDAAAANRADFRARYDEFGNMEGDIPVNEVRGMGTRVREDLSGAQSPVVIDDHLTPAASRAIQMLDEQSSRPSIPNRAAPRAPAAPDTEISGVTLQGVDRMRKHLVAFYKAAAPGSEDRRAVQAIMRSFDGQIEQTISNGLFSGDPRALDVLRGARASYSRYRQMFGPQGAGDDVGTAMRRIVERNATPEETTNMILGSGKIGQAGLPVRIADRLEQVLGADSEAWNSIRQAMWQKASQVRNTSGEIDAARSATSVQDFARSTLGQRMFAPEALAAMRGHAQATRDLDGVIAGLPATRAAERAQEGYQAAFGGEGLTGTQRQVLARMAEGTAQPQEVAQAMFGVISGGKPADASRAIAAVERIVGADSPVMGAVRQGVWQKLTQNPFGKDQKGQQALVQAVQEFLHGKGQDVARQLYTPEERALMNRYAEAVRKTIIPKYSRTNSDTAVATAALGHQQISSIASAIASILHTGPIGHIGGHMVSKLIGNRIKGAQAKGQLTALDESLRDVIPPPPKSEMSRPSRTVNAYRHAVPLGDLGEPRKPRPVPINTAPPFGQQNSPYGP